MRRMTLAEQLDNYAITQEVADEARQTREEFRRLDSRIAELEAALEFIASQEPLTFAECSVAEAIIARAKTALRKE